MEELAETLLSLLLGDGWPEVTGGIWAVCEVPEALCAQRPGMGMDVSAESWVGPFHVAGSIPDWPVLHSNRFNSVCFQLTTSLGTWYVTGL